MARFESMPELLQFATPLPKDIIEGKISTYVLIPPGTMQHHFGAMMARYFMMFPGTVIIKVTIVH
ncbi:hypothetical protein Syun_004756 [Stephania yunnanensis]|uniref:Uncharacterized protein n=1 Tax=Stephania yunnanensis TaxID=152371 RepID=A0AAP0Q2U8_9MAGN